MEKRSIPNQPISWQHPFVDVFRKFNVFDSSNKAKKGGVSDGQDNNIGRRVLKITGAVSASNFVNIPDPDSGIKSLQLTGRYLYLEFLGCSGKYFNIHLDLNIANRETVTRFSISNMFDEYKVVGTNNLQIPYPSDAPLKWTVMVLDLQYHLENFGLFQHADISTFSNIHSLRSIQVCSTLSIRGIFTADYCYSVKSLPKELDFKPPKDRQWSGAYQIVYYPSQIDPDLEQNEKPPQPLQLAEEKENVQSLNNEVTPENRAGSVDAAMRQSQKSFRSNKSQISHKQSLAEGSVQVGNTSTMNASNRNFHPSNLVRRSQISKKNSQNDIHNQLQPYPICKLNHTLGFTGNSCPDIRWSKCIERPDELIYASGSMIISSEVGAQKQRFFQGHTSPISCLDVSRDGKWIVSAQDGKRAVVMIWDFMTGDCVIAFQCPQINIKCVSFSFNRQLLATVGLDEMNREIIIIWDLSEVQTPEKKISILTKQISDFNILCLKFSPVELDKLVSCGRENIRFWRIKNSHLRGTPVILNHHARNTVFTVLDFEYAFDNPQAALQNSQIQRVFVGSKQGMIFQINYETKEKESVYKCHDGAITSLCLSASVCVTGSEDLYLRVWPLNLQEFKIEAKQEGVLISLDVSLDSLKIAFGTSNGNLVILNQSTYKQDTFLRSHTDEITEMHFHPFCNYLVTLSTDFSIRLWDMEKYEQIYEFPFPSDEICTSLSCNSTSMTFATGFSTGIFRIFDIEKTGSIFEARYHQSAIKHIEYSPDAKYLIVADENGFYCLYDVQRNYQPVKTFEREICGKYQHSAFSHDSELLAMIGDSGTHINIVDTYTMSNILKIFCANTTIKKLVWSSNNSELFALTEDSKVKVFGIERSDPQHNEAYMFREISCMHRNGLNNIALSNNFKYMASVGADNLLKVWDYEFSLVGPGSNQVFLSHISKINCILFTPDNTKILTAGGFEGIYEWNFMGDLTKQEKNVDFSEYIPVNTKKMPLSNSTYQANPVKRANKGSEQQPLVYSDDEQGDNRNQNQFHDQHSEDYADIQQALSVQRHEGGGGMPFKVDRVVSDVNEINHQAYQQHGQHPPYFEVSNSEQSHPVRTNIHHHDQNQYQNIQSNQSPNNRDEDEDSDADHIGPLAQLMSQQKNLTGYNPSKKSNSLLSAASNAPRFTPARVEPVKPQEIEFHKQKRKRDRRNALFKYAPNEVRKENNIPFRHYYVPNSRSEVVQEKNLKLRDNKEEFLTEYIVSYNNDSHDNVVWNYLSGWFAYTSQNMIIIENLTKSRQQKIINLPDKISCLTISKDFKYLVAGSASYNQSEVSNIYVIDCKTSEIVKTLGFHSRGVQSIALSSNRKYIISAGNCKECTIAIWEWPSGILLTSSYTIDRINDVKISEIVHTPDNVLEFCTVGRDTVQFWALDKSHTLKYFDVFVPKQEFPPEKNGNEKSNLPNFKAPEVIAVDYILFGNKQYAVAGLSTGEIIVVDNEEFKIIYRTQVSVNGSEILDVRVSNQMHRLIVTAMDENIHYWDFERQLAADNPFSHPEFMISWAKLKLTSAATSFFLDPTFKEGLVGLYNGGIYYVSLDNKYRTVLTGSIDSKYAYETHIVNERFIVTTHADGRMKLWNIQTAEEVMEYKFQSSVKSIMFEAKTNKLFCFFENNNDIKSINLQKFFQAETYVFDEVKPSDKTSTEYPIRSFETIVGGRTGKFVVMKSGDIFTFEQLIKDKRPLVRFQKIFKVPNVTDFIPYSEKSLFFATTTKGKVSVYLVDYASDRQIGYGFTLIDECDYLENPHGSLIDASLEQKNLTQILYTDAVSTTKVAVSHHNENIYYAINSSLQYMFIRNYQKRQILQRINLHDFPLSLALMESKKSYKVLVGLQNGSLEKINIEQKDDREIYTSVLDGGIISVFTQKSNNPTTNVINDRIITSSKDGLAIYSLNANV